MLTRYVDEIIGGHQCGLRQERSTTDKIFSIFQILRKLEYNGAVYRLGLFKYFKQAYDSVKRKVFFNILIQFVIPMRQVRLFKIVSYGNYSKVV